MAAVANCASRVGAHRVGLFIGTSTSGILQTELAYRQRDPDSGALPASFYYAGSHNVFSAAAFSRELLGIRGPAAVVSTACSSSAKAFGSAQRMIELGVIDAAVVGGVDSLCLTTLYGFHSLQLSSSRQCRPFAADRDGISIGEAAAFVLLEKSPARRHRERYRTARGGRIQRRLSSFGAASAGPRRAPRDGIRAQCGRPRSGCDRLHQSARHGHDQQRQRGMRCSHAGVRRRRAMQFDQGCHRAHAGRGRRARGRDLHAGLARPADSRRAEYWRGRSGPAAQLLYTQRSLNPSATR